MSKITTLYLKFADELFEDEEESRKTLESAPAFPASMRDTSARVDHDLLIKAVSIMMSEDVRKAYMLTASGEESRADKGREYDLVLDGLKGALRD